MEVKNSVKHIAAPKFILTAWWFKRTARSEILTAVNRKDAII